MISVPRWLEDILSEFASGYGLEKFALNENGTAALKFENGVIFRLEYAANSLALLMTAEPPSNVAEAKVLLSSADPLRRGPFQIRAGLLENPSRAVMSVRLEDSDITLGNLEGVMAELWRMVENYRRRLGA
ncbi:MAG: hypothetical protein J6R18_03395 [Kiritimatiellae bacterium]|nr:hypothetical protein [Kiritimatiellia bacterium]